MWELDIIINYKYRKYLFYIKDSIISNPKYDKKGVFAIVKDGNNAVLSIAILEPTKQLLKDIEELVAETLIFTEKEAYITKSRRLPRGEFRQAFVKALVLLNMQKEIALAKKYIDLQSSTINIHSLFSFRLKHLEAIWQSHLDAICPNDMEVNNDNLLDILQAIISSNIKNVEVVITDAYRITARNINIVATDEADVIANLILISPKKITIDKNVVLSGDTIILLQYLFQNKLVL